MSWKLPKLERDINLEIKVAQQTPSKTQNQLLLTHHNQTTERQGWKKKKSWKLLGKKWHIAHRGKVIWRTVSISETVEGIRKWINVSKVLKDQEGGGAYIWESLECMLMTQYGFRFRKWGRNLEISTGVGLRNKAVKAWLATEYQIHTHVHTHKYMWTPRGQELIQ